MLLTWTKRSLLLLSVFLIWIVLAFAGSLIGSNFLDLQIYERLATEGIHTEGVVTSKERNNHGFIRYKYQIGENQFGGMGSPGNGTPSFKEIQVGQSVPVVYDPISPSISCVGYPNVLLAQKYLGMTLFAVAFATVLTVNLIFIGGFFFLKSRKARSSFSQKG